MSELLVKPDDLFGVLRELYLDGDLIVAVVPSAVENIHYTSLHVPSGKVTEYRVFFVKASKPMSDPVVIWNGRDSLHDVIGIGSAGYQTNGSYLTAYAPGRGSLPTVREGAAASQKQYAKKKSVARGQSELIPARGSTATTNGVNRP